MNRLFLFDVDGTFSIHGRIPQSAKNAINLIHQKKDYVFLCTGRCLGQLEDILTEIKVDGIIANNGAYACFQNKPFFESKIDVQLIEKLLRYGYPVGILSKDCYGVLQNDPNIMADFCEYFKIQKPLELRRDYIHHHAIYSLGVYTSEDISNTIKELPELHFVKVCPIGYDILNATISKATPIQKLKELFPSYQLIGFGDNYNDMEMLKEVDVAIVMGQAPKEVQALADFITKKPEEDGIWYAITELLQ